MDRISALVKFLWPATALFCALSLCFALPVLASESMDEGRALFAAQEFEEALVRFDAVTVAEPDSAEGWFWAAYSAHKLGDPEGAKSRVARALELEPQWVDARYLAGLTAFLLGKEEGAREHFSKVVELAPDTDLGRSAATYLERLARVEAESMIQETVPETQQELAPPQRDAADPKHPKLRSALLSLAGHVDTNPSFASDRTVGDSSLAKGGVSAAGRVVLPLLRRERLRLSLSPSFLLRAHPSSSDVDLAQGFLRGEFALPSPKFEAWWGVGAGFSFFGWRPLLDVEESWMGVAWKPQDWAQTRLTLRGVRRGVHQEGYGNLQGLGYSLRLEERFRTKSVRAGFGYGLGGDKAEPYTLRWSFLTAEGQAGAAQLLADSSYFGHGPFLWLSLGLGKRVLVSGRLSLQWRRYGVPEEATYTTALESSTWSGERRDLRASFGALAQLQLYASLHLALRYSALLNRSSIQGLDVPVERDFTRHLVSLGLEIRP